MLRKVKTGVTRQSSLRWITGIVPVFFLLCATFSCALTTQHGNGTNVSKANTSVSVEEPKPGDVKIMGGIEFIYGKNVRWPTMPGEPEYKWIRKDQYASRPFDTLADSLSDRAKDKKEIEDLQKRLDRLEQEIKGLDDTQAAPERR